MSNLFLPGNNTIITLDGGFGIRVLNKTGEASVKGKIVAPSSSVDDAVSLVAVDSANPIGVIDTPDVPDGSYMYITIAGKAKVLFSNATTRNYFARVMATGDAGVTAGLAISEALPVPPFSTNKHFQEVGHILEAIASPPYLALCVVHFN